MNAQVVKAFCDLYEKGLIYRGEYMVNYDPVLNTVISDQEVVYKEEK
jgi:valine--tRNA ligase